MEKSKCKIKCRPCGADLAERNAVTREYINKDGGPSKYGKGHFVTDPHGSWDYEPDENTILSDGRYDLVDGSDTCTNCSALIG